MSIKFYGYKNWLNNIRYDPVPFIFPILTNMSFYGDAKINHNSKVETESLHDPCSIATANDIEVQDINEHEHRKKSNDIPDNDIEMQDINDHINSRSTDIPDNDKHDEKIENEDGEINSKQSSSKLSINCEDLTDIETNDKTCTLQFSVEQSNVLYLLFLFGFTLSLGGDLWLQYSRGDLIQKVLC